MSDKTSLGDRIKNNYEVRARTSLTRRMPVIARLDGKAFHTYTKGLNRPFDDGLIEDMIEWGTSIRGAWIEENREHQIDIGNIIVKKGDIITFIKELEAWTEV